MSPPAPSNAVAAGEFGHWLMQAREALRGNAGSEVPCGECTGCCTSGYSVQLRPEDHRAAAAIPVEFVVNPPGFPAGHLTMKPLDNGVCPMLSDGKCTIYRMRPQTCLDYDCRIFAAAGIEAGGPDKFVINKRVREWRFAYPTEADRLAHEAVRTAATFIREHGASFSRRVPTAPMGIAVLAIKTYEVFLDASANERSIMDTAAAILAANHRFDTGREP